MKHVLERDVLEIAEGSAFARRLTRVVTGAFRLMGAEVWVNPDDEANLVRRGRAGEPAFVVQAQGLPNLMHELGHVLALGRLEDDHGIDYRSIPYDPATASGQAVLIDELCATALSCAYLERCLRSAGRPGPARDEDVLSWFAEQVEIQPVFYGIDADDLASLRGLVRTFLDQHGAETDAAYARCVERAERWFVGLGVPGADLAVASHRPTKLWSAYEAGLSGVGGARVHSA